MLTARASKIPPGAPVALCFAASVIVGVAALTIGPAYAAGVEKTPGDAAINAPPIKPTPTATPPAVTKSGAVTSDPIADLQAVIARSKTSDHQRARFDPIHFKPAIDTASDEACLVCHKEISSAKPRDTTPAGVNANDTEAWYQTLSTYSGSQEMFHWRHLQSPYAKQVMNLKCNFCHQGDDLREKSPHVTAMNSAGQLLTSSPDGSPPFTLRKTVNPSNTCLLCHGAYPAEIMGLSGTWFENAANLETPEQKNGCLTCHADQFRTIRHQVSYLNPKGVEEAAKEGSDVCYGCHGGRQWYRISYPYPRHAWPDMPADIPDWAKNRPTQSDPRYALPQK